MKQQGTENGNETTGVLAAVRSAPDDARSESGSAPEKRKIRMLIPALIGAAAVIGIVLLFLLSHR